MHDFVLGEKKKATVSKFLTIIWFLIYNNDYLGQGLRNSDRRQRYMKKHIRAKLFNNYNIIAW